MLGRVGSSLLSSAKVVLRATGSHSLVALRVLEPYAVKVAHPVLRKEKRGNPPDLSDTARTHKMIRIEKEEEIILMKLCSQIHFDDFKKKRSDLQREERRLKRVNKYNSTMLE